MPLTAWSMSWGCRARLTVMSRDETAAAARLGARGAGDEPHPHVRHFVDAQPVAPERPGTDHERTRVVDADLGDLHHGRDRRVLRRHLAAVLPHHRCTEQHRFETGVVEAGVHAGVEHEVLQQLEQRFDAERSGLDGVLEEVRLEEPFGDVDVLLADDHTEPSLARPREMRRPVEHQEHVTGESSGPRAESFRTHRQFGRRTARPLLVGQRAQRSIGVRRSPGGRPGRRTRPVGRTRTPSPSCRRGGRRANTRPRTLRRSCRRPGTRS